jgi:hypothetical protein
MPKPKEDDSNVPANIDIGSLGSDEPVQPLGELNDKGEFIGDTDGYDEPDVDFELKDSGVVEFDDPDDLDDDETETESVASDEVKPESDETPSVESRETSTSGEIERIKGELESANKKLQALSGLDNLLREDQAFRDAVLSRARGADIDLSKFNLGEMKEPAKPEDFDPFDAFNDPESTSAKWLNEHNDYLRHSSRLEALAIHRKNAEAQRGEQDKAMMEGVAKAQEQAESVLRARGYSGDLVNQFMAWATSGFFKDAESAVNGFEKIFDIKPVSSRRPSSDNGSTVAKAGTKTRGGLSFEEDLARTFKSQKY